MAWLTITSNVTSKLFGNQKIVMSLIAASALKQLRLAAFAHTLADISIDQLLEDLIY